MTRNERIFSTIILLASIVGAIAAVYALLAHYDAASSDFCSISETFDCDLVNKSKYSEIFNIPVSAMGLAAYVFFFFTVPVFLKKRSEWLMNLLVFGSVTGLLFSLYLTFIEAFVLKAWCMLCIASQISIIFVVVGVFGLKYAATKKETTITELHQ